METLFKNKIEFEIPVKFFHQRFRNTYFSILEHFKFKTNLIYQTFFEHICSLNMMQKNVILSKHLLNFCFKKLLNGFDITLVDTVCIVYSYGYTKCWCFNIYICHINLINIPYFKYLSIQFSCFNVLNILHGYWISVYFFFTDNSSWC